jgi:hypothetical protein
LVFPKTWSMLYHSRTVKTFPRFLEITLAALPVTGYRSHSNQFLYQHLRHCQAYISLATKSLVTSANLNLD